MNDEDKSTACFICIQLDRSAGPSIKSPLESGEVHSCVDSLAFVPPFLTLSPVITPWGIVPRLASHCRRAYLTDLADEEEEETKDEFSKRLWFTSIALFAFTVRRRSATLETIETVELGRRWPWIRSESTVHFYLCEEHQSENSRFGFVGEREGLSRRSIDVLSRCRSARTVQ